MLRMMLSAVDKHCFGCRILNSFDWVFLHVILGTHSGIMRVRFNPRLLCFFNVEKEAALPESLISDLMSFFERSRASEFLVIEP